MELKDLSKLLSRYRLAYQSEEDLQELIERILLKEGLPYFREVILSPQDRIDFTIGKIGIEIKIKGTLTNLTRQLHRYTLHPNLDSILVVTDKNILSTLPDTLNNKNIRVHKLIKL